MSANVIGTEKNLVFDGKSYYWTGSSDIANVWRLTPQDELDDVYSVRTLAKLTSRELNINPEQKYIAMMKTVLHDRHDAINIPWVDVLPPREHRRFVDNIIEQIKDITSSNDVNYLVSTWGIGTKFLSSLRRATINVDEYRRVLSSANLQNESALGSFAPDQSGRAKKIIYDRFGTKTGRLTVSSGPQILTIKKELKHQILKSSYPNGCIVSIDFAALEARVLLYESGGRCDHHDLYQKINDDLFSGAASRQQVKAAVISEVYGSSKYTLGTTLGISGKELDDFVLKIKMFFKTSELRKRIKGEFVTTGRIKNRYGRPIVVDDPLDHIFINYYAQSTGVDVALLGFDTLMRDNKRLKGIKPLFVLHDALILDVPEQYKSDVMALSTVKVPGYVQKFYVKPEVIVG